MLEKCTFGILPQNLEGPARTAEREGKFKIIRQQIKKAARPRQKEDTLDE